MTLQRFKSRYRKHADSVSPTLGSKSWLVWWLTGYMPSFILETAMMRMFGLSKLRPADARKKLE